MKPRVIVISGRICSGKSSLAQNLKTRANASIYKTNELILQQLPKTRPNRRAMQLAGQRLDRDTGGRWLAMAVNSRMASESPRDLVVVDSVRISEQVYFLRRSGWQVIHVHLEAHTDELARRYTERPQKIAELPTYADLSRNRTERNVDRLKDIADVVINSDACSENDVYARVISRLEVRPATAQPTVDVLIGGQYGSEGKGNIAHYLAPEYDVLIRVGGPNAGHQVFRPGLDPYTFHLLPSGALANSSATLVIGAGAVLSLDQLLKEIADIAVPYDRLLIDPQAMIIDQSDIEWELANLQQQIASTAQGVGKATARKLLHRWPMSDVRLARDVPALKHYIRDSIEFFAGCLSSGSKMLVEGTQGTALSLHHGSYPHVTSRITTAMGCLAEAGLAARHVRRVVMVCRTYPIRVGNTASGNTSGPMSNEITVEEVSRRSGIAMDELKKTETTSTTKRPRRIAEFDWAQLRRSLVLNGPTDIALTFADYLGIKNREAYRYEQLSEDTLRFIEELEKVSGVPVSLISTRFDERNVIDRRAW